MTKISIYLAHLYISHNICVNIRKLRLLSVGCYGNRPLCPTWNVMEQGVSINLNNLGLVLKPVVLLRLAISSRS